jgi:hypothetical protein
MLLIGLGIGALASQLGAVTVSAVPDDQSPEVGGVQNTMTNLGASIGTALAGSVMIAACFIGVPRQHPEQLGDSGQGEVAGSRGRLAGGVPFVSDADLQQALDDAHVSRKTTSAALDAYGEARISGLTSVPRNPRVRRAGRPLPRAADPAEPAAMSVAAPAAPAVPKRRFRLKRVLVGALAILVIGAFANLVGWDLRGWFSNLWDTISEISIGYLIAGVALKTVQTSLTAFGWYSILRFAMPSACAGVDIWACYAASVALNGDPAREHRDARDAADVHGDHRRRDLRGDPRRVRRAEDLLHGDRDLHLPLPVPVRRRLVRHQVRVRPRAPMGDDRLLRGGAFLLYLLPAHLAARARLVGDAKEGGAILGHPRKYFVRVFLPSFSRGSRASA